MRVENFPSAPKKLLVAAFLGALLIVSSLPSSSFLQKSVVAQSSCPDNLTLKMGSYGGAPNTFNMLSALPFAGVASSLLQWYEMYPPASTNGTLDYNESVINSYSYNTNYTQWTFNVKPNLKWSDGTAVTAQDIANTYSSSYALSPSADFVNAAAELKGISVVNSSQVVFNLNKSDADFAERVGSSLFTPIMPSSFTSQGPNFNGYGTVDVADGAFYADNYQTGASQGVFLRNQYFNPLPKACELLINYYESDSSIPQYIQSDAIDFGPIPTSAAATLAASPNVHIIDEKSQLLSVVSYNMTKYPYNMTAFRQALVYGINQSQVQSQAYNGYFETAYSAEGGIPQLATSWYSSHQQNYSYNPTNATNLLASINIKKGTDGFLQYPNSSGQPNGTDVTLTMWYDNSFVENAQAVTIMQNNLQSLGFKVVTNAAALGTLVSDSYGNVNGINNDMIYFLSLGPIYGYPWTAGLPSYAIDIPFAAPPSWEGPANSHAQAEFESNLTALESTRNPTLEYQYLQNIQLLNSQNIPALVVGYGDSVWAYNTLRWSNWPSDIVILPNTLNNIALAGLTPTSSSSTTSGTSPPPTTTSSMATQSSTAPASTTTTSGTTSGTSGGGISSSLLLAIAVVVVVIVVAGIAFALTRRRGAPAPTT